jgi:ADP-heptose:LPS heptosyltransferase
VDILVLHPGALGDTILSFPALGLLRRHYPEAQITLAGNTDFLGIAGADIADRKISLAALPLHRLYSDDPLHEGVRTVFESYDRIVAWTGSGHPGFIGNLGSLRSEVIVASWKPEARESRHVSRIFAHTLQPWIPVQENPAPASIALSPGAIREGREWISGHGGREAGAWIAFHPGAGSAAKRWPQARFEQLAQRLIRAHAVQIILIEGPAEPGLAASISGSFPEADILSAKDLDVIELAAVLSCCAGFVGNDSGVSHLAAALRVPSVLVFGPTSPEHWAPLGDNVRVLRDTVACPACERGMTAAHRCMEQITTDAVLGALMAVR